MRQVKYLSYSSFHLFEENPSDFYVKYLADTKLPREPQNHYMAVGSSFDAYVKAYLYRELVNKGDPKYEFEALFKEQVEEQNRTDHMVDGKLCNARKDGKEVWDAYQKVGGLDSLMKDMKGCVGEPRFESTVEGEIGSDGIMILGKPDVQYIHSKGARVIHDFKVNGFYSKTAAKPRAGYLTLLPEKKMHRNASPHYHKGILVNAAAPLHMSANDWAEQLTMYAWAMGESIGSDYILTIDQLCCDSVTRQHKLAKHSAICMTEWQLKLYERLKRCWYAIKNGHIFLELPYEENCAKIKLLDMQIKGMADQDPVFNSVNGTPTRVR